MPNTRRVIIFSTNYLPAIGGAELATKEITDRMPGWHFDMITPRYSRSRAKSEKIGSVNVYRVGVGLGVIDKFLLPIAGFFKARALQRRSRYDVAWSMMASQASIAAALFKKSHKDVPLVLTLQEGDEEEYLKRYVGGVSFLYKVLIQPWYHLIFRRADHITVISEYLKERASQIVPTTPKTVVPNGVDVRRFAIEQFEDKRSELREQLGYTKNDTVLVTVSRLVYKNAVDDIVRSLQYLPESVKLLIIGEGTDYKALNDLTESLGAGGRVNFLGMVVNENVPAYLKASDIFVRPSRSEGFGISFVEAMASEIAVIATPVGGIRDFLKDGETGVLCEVDDPESIARAVKRIMDDSRLRERITKNARRMVEDRYEWNGVAVRMSEVFELTQSI